MTRFGTQTRSSLRSPGVESVVRIVFRPDCVAAALPLLAAHPGRGSEARWYAWLSVVVVTLAPRFIGGRKGCDIAGALTSDYPTLWPVLAVRLLKRACDLVHFEQETRKDAKVVRTGPAVEMDSRIKRH